MAADTKMCEEAAAYTIETHDRVETLAISKARSNIEDK